MSALIARWNALNETLAAINPDNRRQLRDAIAHVYQAIATTSGRKLQDFAGFTEAEIVDGLEQRARDVERGTIAVALDGDDASIVLDAARLLRAIEEAVVEGEGYLVGDAEGDLEKASRTSDGRYYVISRMTPLAVPERRPFGRRALLHHRVLPTEVGIDPDDRFKVRLHRSRLTLSEADMLAGDRRQRRYGAAFFPELKVDLIPEGQGPFLVKALDGFDAPSLLADHLARGRAAACDAIVWGELTMPEGSVEVVQQWLSDEAFGDAQGFRFLVLGSWHRKVGGEMRNVAMVLDGDGEPLCEVQKWAKFWLGDRPENIVPGNEIHVLIGEEDLILLAICRDFLEIGNDQPYGQLNVDIAVVPSMIATIEETKTLVNHAAAAHQLGVLYGTRTMVVAQPSEPLAGKPVGQVMAFPSKPLESPPIAVDGSWYLCALDSP